MPNHEIDLFEICPSLKSKVTFSATGHSCKLGDVIDHYYYMVFFTFLVIHGPRGNLEKQLGYIINSIKDNYDKLESEKDLSILFITSLRAWCKRNMNDTIWFGPNRLKQDDLIDAIERVCNAIDNSTLLMKRFFGGREFRHMEPAGYQEQINQITNNLNGNKVAHILFAFYAESIKTATLKSRSIAELRRKEYYGS